MKAGRAVILAALLAVLVGGGVATGAMPFDPDSYIESISDVTPEANADVTRRTILAAGQHVTAWEVISVPAGWDIARDQFVPDGDIVGDGTLIIDLDCDGSLQTYPLTVVEVGREEPGEKTNWKVLGIPFVQLLMIVRGNANDGHTIETLMFPLPGVFTPPLCAPMDYTITHWGFASPSGNPVMTNPDPAPALEASYTWTAEYFSSPLPPGEHTVITSDVVLIGPDADGDGIPDPSDPDDDNDSLGLEDPFGLFFRDEVELFIGTLPTQACPATNTPDDEDPDAWGPDWDDSTDVDGTDVILLAQRFGTEEGTPPPVGLQPYGRRFDIYPTGVSLSKIDGSDVIVLATYFGESCT